MATVHLSECSCSDDLAGVSLSYEEDVAPVRSSDVAKVLIE